MTVYFTSDMHFGHARINELAGRPFTSADEMNDVLEANWNGAVAPNDTVYVLGDACMGKIVDSLAIIGRLNGNKWLIAGNHDRMHPANEKRGEKRMEWLDRYCDAGFVSCWYSGFTLRDLFEQPVELSHFPYTGDHTAEERYAEYRPVNTGLPLLHGHVHEAWKVRHTDDGVLMINVGVDVWDFTPVSASTIQAIINREDT